MQVNKDFQYRVGFGSYESNRQGSSVLKICYFTTIMIITFITACVGLVIHFNEFRYVIETIFAFSLYVMMLTSYFSTLYHRRRLQKLLTELQEVVNQRKFLFSIFCSPFD